MVRINLIHPRFLTDNHLIAEYREILMLVGHVKKHPKILSVETSYNIYNPIRFFKDKLLYITIRHRNLVREMLRRGFRANKTLDLKGCPMTLINNWEPTVAEVELVKQRIIQRLNEKPWLYRYYRKHRDLDYLVNLVKTASYHYLTEPLFRRRDEFDIIHGIPFAIVKSEVK